MQAVKRFWLLAVLSTLLLLGYVYVSEWEVSVGTTTLSDAHYDNKGRSSYYLEVTNNTVENETDPVINFSGGISAVQNTKIVEPIEELQSPHSEQLSDKKLPTLQNLSPVPASANDTETEELKEDVVKEHANIQSDNADANDDGDDNDDDDDTDDDQVTDSWISKMVREIHLSYSQLDELYNVTKVQNINLHNITYLDNYYRYNYKVVESRMTVRMLRVDAICRSLSGKSFRNYNLYQLNELGISWCPVFKSGSTTWRNYFIDMFVSNPPQWYVLDLLQRRQLLVGTKGRFENNKQFYRGEEESNIRFSAVRHPFSRLVSHVKSSGRDDEMVTQKGLWIQSAMIAARSNRVGNPAADLTKFKSEFENYFSWLKKGRPGGTFEAGSPDNPFLNPPYPLLSELVNHIISMRRARRDWDGHWMPAHEFCDICINKFQYIIKLEEEPLELWFLVDKLGLWSDRATFLNRTNNSTTNTTEMVEVWEEVNKLNQEQIAFLNRHFDVDFRMFEYHRTYDIFQSHGEFRRNK